MSEMYVLNKYARADIIADALDSGIKVVLVWCNDYRHIKEVMNCQIAMLADTPNVKVSKANSIISVCDRQIVLFCKPEKVMAYDRNKTVLIDWRR